uniref:Reverse transcriptase domain-containing protein n=1 Tax=Fagus sylvatica TaxID=28930 RepID=A0A2N9GE95_FAGSY
MVQELMHNFKTRKLKIGMVGIKVDLSKAYDRVSWCFLTVILKHMGFHQRFVNWIEKCISSVSYTLLINGCKAGRINPRRGLRQGDPLSPYLFILSQEILSRLIERAVQRGDVHGVKANRVGLVVTHLMYADDIILFSRAKLAEIKALEQCVKTYCSWSGQQLNTDKSGVFVSKTVHVNYWKQISQHLGMKKLSLDSKYLGVPMFLSRKSSENFKHMVQQVDNKLKLIDEARGEWDLAKLKDTFDKASICAIVKISLSMRNKLDKLMWVANNHGNFTVKSAYFLQQGVMTSIERSMWKKLWNLKIHERYKMLLWRIALNILPTRQRLQELGQVLDAKCPLCNCEEESSTRMETKVSVSVAEAKSLRCALVMAKLLKLRRVEVEGDSKICIDKLNKVSLKNHDHIDKWEARTVFEDILDLANEMDHQKKKERKKKNSKPTGCCDDATPRESREARSTGGVALVGGDCSGDGLGGEMRD